MNFGLKIPIEIYSFSKFNKLINKIINLFRIFWFDIIVQLFSGL